MSFQRIIPTRTNLFKLQKRLQFARRGKKLLDVKREQFYNEIKRLRNDALQEKKKIRISLDKGYLNLNYAYAFSGKQNIKFLAEYLKKFSEIRFKVFWERTFGIEVPRFRDLNYPKQKYIPYGFMDTSVYLDRAIKYFHEGFDTILKLAEIEGELFRLAFEYQKLKRRIKSLEDFKIPKLEQEIRTVENILEDLEMEENIRLAKIKKRLEAMETGLIVH